MDDQNAGNYAYDKTGNLIADVSEEVVRIEWNVADKVTTVAKEEAKESLFFEYGALGSRVWKHAGGKESYYARDAGGNVLAGPLFRAKCSSGSANFATPRRFCLRACPWRTIRRARRICFNRRGCSRPAPRSKGGNCACGQAKPSSKYRLAISFAPGTFRSGSSRREVEIRAVATETGGLKAEKTVFDRTGTYLADTLTGRIDTLQNVGWPEFLNILNCETGKIAFDNIRWRHNYSGRKPKNVRAIDKNILTENNFFADCLAYALNELAVAKDAVAGAQTRVECELECPREPVFLFLEAANGDTTAPNPLELIRAATAEEKWLDPAADEFLETKIAERFPGEEAIARLTQQLRNSAADSSALPTRAAAAAYAANRLRRLADLQVRLRAVSDGFVSSDRNALYAAYASPALKAVRLELQSLGYHNLDRYYKTRTPPRQAVAICQLEELETGAAPEYATLFCYSPRANVIQTYPAVGEGDGAPLLRSYPMAIAPNWPVVGLALEDGRIALLSRKERAKLSWRAANRAPSEPALLRFRFEGRRAGSLEALRAALKKGA